MGGDRHEASLEQPGRLHNTLSGWRIAGSPVRPLIQQSVALGLDQHNMEEIYQSLIRSHLPGWRCIISSSEENACYFWAVRSKTGGSNWSAIAPVTWAEQAISFGPLSPPGGYVACGQWGEYLWECRYESSQDRLYWRRDDGLEVESSELDWPDRQGVESILRELGQLAPLEPAGAGDAAPRPHSDSPSELSHDSAAQP